jgi:prolyl oligopeptidase
MHHYLIKKKLFFKIKVMNRIFFMRIFFPCIFLLIGFIPFAQFKYPPVKTEPFDTTIFGIKIKDKFFWMSKKEKEQEVLQYARAQTKLAQNILDSIPGGKAIEQEMDELYAALDEEVWNLKSVGDIIYYFRSIPGEGQWVCRRKNSTAPEEKILSGSINIKGQKYAVRKRVFAHSKPLLALMLTQKGESNPHIRIYDMDKKEFLSDSIAPVMFNDARGVSMAWLSNDAALLYTQAPPTDKHHEIYYNGKIRLHLLGTDPAGDEPIFGMGLNEKISLKPQETPYIYGFRNSPYLIARIRSSDDNNYAFAVHYTKLNGAKTPWKKLKDYVNIGEGFDARENFLYAATTGIPRRRVVKLTWKQEQVRNHLFRNQKI